MPPNLLLQLTLVNDGSLILTLSRTQNIVSFNKIITMVTRDEIPLTFGEDNYLISNQRLDNMLRFFAYN